MGEFFCATSDATWTVQCLLGDIRRHSNACACSTKNRTVEFDTGLFRMLRLRRTDTKCVPCNSSKFIVCVAVGQLRIVVNQQSGAPLSPTPAQLGQSFSDILVDVSDVTLFKHMPLWPATVCACVHFSKRCTCYGQFLWPSSTCSQQMAPQLTTSKSDLY